MFKNMKLSTKITSGFTVLLLISLVMGLFAWQGLRRVLNLAALNQGGVQAVEYLNQCATSRRDFAIRNFEKQDGQTKNAADKLYDANKELSSALAALNQQAGLMQDERNLISECEKNSTQYKSVFDRIVDAQKSIEESFKAWRDLGNKFTTTVADAVNAEIEPEIRKAQENNEIGGLSKWTAIQNSLNEKVVQNFLLLRVRANVLNKAENESEYKNYQGQCQITKEGLKTWADLISGEAKLQPILKTISDSIDGYDTAGKSFYENVVQKQKADAEKIGRASCRERV